VERKRIMSKQVTNPVVGMFVYRAYEATKPGKVIGIIPQTTPKTPGYCEDDLDIKWLDGRVHRYKACSLNDFEALINEHRKKLKTHTSKLPALQKL
jgi:hypothetical protein